MNPSDKTSIVTFIIVAAFIAWRVYARVQRMVRRQKFSGVRAWLSATLFPVLIVLLAAVSVARPSSELAELAEFAGVGIGVTLGIIGLRKTKYETTPEGLFYTPNAHIGIALSLLFVGRLGYRYFQMYTSTAGFTAPPVNNFVTSPLTLVIFGTLAAYYSTYAIGLLRWGRAATSGIQK